MYVEHVEGWEKVGLNCLHNPESEAVIYEVSRERLTAFLSVYLSLFALVVLSTVS